MSVWYVIPSKRPPEQCEPVFQRWCKMGYNVLVQRDIGESIPTVHIQRLYLGYAEAVNFLARLVLEGSTDVDWIVTGGDDMLPDPHKSAEEIARECSQYFRAQIPGIEPPLYTCTFGVMQPTGDRWLVNGPGTKPGSECVAGSPWMGREFCRRMYGGRGPLCEEYFHCGEDEELQEVATMLGVFWQRPDLTHYHDHWGRPREGEKLGHASRMPAFLARANSAEEWKRMKATLARRKAAGWPGHEPIP